MIAQNKRSAGLAGLITGCLAAAAAAAPAADITYQGQLKFDGAPVTGPIDFFVTLWDAMVEGREVARGVELLGVPVQDGLFTLSLNFGIDPFNGEPRWLEIMVTDRRNERRETLRPRQPLTAAPVALFAITGNEGPPGPPGSSDLALPFTGTNTANAVAISIEQTSPYTGLGCTINNTLSTQPAIAAVNNGTGPGFFALTAGGHGIWTQTGPAGGNAAFFNVAGVDNTQAALAARNQAKGPAGHLKVTKLDNTSPALLVETFSSGPSAQFTSNPSGQNVNLAPTILAENDQYGPAGQFKVINGQSTATSLKVETVGAGYAMETKTTGAGSGAKFEIANTGAAGHALEATTNGTGHAGLFVNSDNRATTATLKSESRGNNAALHAEALGQGTGLFARASLGADAIVGIANGFGQAATFESTATDNTAAAVEITNAGTNEALRVVNTNPESYEAAYFVGRVDIARTDGVLANGIRLQPTSGGAQIRMFDRNGSGTIVLDAEYGAEQVGRITTDEILINGGADLSERFDVHAQGKDVEPGMVVCIDENKPGKLAVCTTAYDKKVAGIISGAGGVRTGMMMGQSGSVADGAHPVALTGRVYCKVDASAGTIEPGDLLTTSNRPGHAMKVADHATAGGAIIGKAMTGLTEGQGLVLVLVSLQ